MSTTQSDPILGKYKKLTGYIQNARINNRISHAWIFTYSGNQYSRSFIDFWLQLNVCKHSAETGEFCGSCDHCQSIIHEKYPYLFEIKPASKLRQIVIDEIRELEHFLYLKTNNEKKIGLIHHADRMTIQAQNAFLKTLEEPTPDTLLLLLTSNVHALLPTIKSRCHVISLFNDRYYHDFDGRDKLCEALATMKEGSGAKIAASASYVIIEILEKLQKSVNRNDEVKEKEVELDKYRENKEIEKRLANQFEAVKMANYIKVRDELISAVYSWYAQQYMIASGISKSKLANPELCIDASDENEQNAPLPYFAMRNLNLVEKFVQTLGYNVDEKLAIQDFCQEICRKN